MILDDWRQRIPCAVYNWIIINHGVAAAAVQEVVGAALLNIRDEKHGRLM